MNKNEWLRTINFGVDSVEQAVEVLEKRGWIKSATPPEVNNFVKVIVYNPRIDEVFAAQDRYINGQWDYFERQEKDQVLAWREMSTTNVPAYGQAESLNRKEEILAVHELGEKIGYGNMMDIACAIWAMKAKDQNGDPVVANVSTILPCMRSHEAAIAKREVLARVEEIKQHGFTFDVNGGEA